MNVSHLHSSVEPHIPKQSLSASQMLKINGKGRLLSSRPACVNSWKYLGGHGQNQDTG